MPRRKDDREKPRTLTEEGASRDREDDAGTLLGRIKINVDDGLRFFLSQWAFRAFRQKLKVSTTQSSRVCVRNIYNIYIYIYIVYTSTTRYHRCTGFHVGSSVKGTQALRLLTRAADTGAFGLFPYATSPKICRGDRGDAPDGRATVRRPKTVRHNVRLTPGSGTKESTCSSYGYTSPPSATARLSGKESTKGR